MLFLQSAFTLFTPTDHKFDLILTGQHQVGRTTGKNISFKSPLPRKRPGRGKKKKGKKDLSSIKMQDGISTVI